MWRPSVWHCTCITGQPDKWWLETQSYSKSDFDEELALVTIVQPDGETVDLTPALLASLKAGGTK